MRITSGILRGRKFAVPKTGVRPTTERTREAIFASVAARVPGARVLDLFAGSGGLGLEAWSRGAASVTAVEKSSEQGKILEQNFQTLENEDLGAYTVIRADVYAYLKRVGRSFDLVFADPPYDEGEPSQLFDMLGNALAPNGLFVFELHARGNVDIPQPWELLKEKKYGGTQVLFLKWG